MIKGHQVDGNSNGIHHPIPLPHTLLTQYKIKKKLKKLKKRPEEGNTRCTSRPQGHGDETITHSCTLQDQSYLKAS